MTANISRRRLIESSIVGTAAARRCNVRFCVQTRGEMG